MGTEIYNGPLGEVRAASTAAGGTALSTTATNIEVPDGTHYVTLVPRNFAGATVIKYSFNPYLVVFKTTDSLVAAANYTDYSVNAQDASTSTLVTLSSLSTAAAGDFLYVGSHLPFRGVSCYIHAANGNASVLTVNYWNGTAWGTITATDNSANGGVSLSYADTVKTVTWTVPSDWASHTLIASADTLLKQWPFSLDYYWTRWQWSAALDSSTTLYNILSLNRSTSYAELIEGMLDGQTINKGLGGIGNIEALTDAGTANLIVNVATRAGDRRFA